MALMDLALYMPAVQRLFGAPIQPLPPSPSSRPLRHPLTPVYAYYAANGCAALFFLFLAHWETARQRLGRAYYPLLLLILFAVPILISTTVVPRFPPGPLANAEGMALRQLPVLFVALALVAWEYRFAHVALFSAAVTSFELALLFLNLSQSRVLLVYSFIAVIRLISFLAVGYFISALVARLRQQRESLRKANADLTHYASTLERLAVSRERNRLARDLHDTLAHSLTAISVSLETARAYFDLDREKSRSLLDSSLQATRTGLEETRRALRALRSSDLEDLGLRLALQKLAQSAAARAALDLELALQDPLPSLSPDVEQAIYRVAQEAIENAARHARAKTLSIQLSHNEQTTLIVADDGIGFDVKVSASSSHFGLMGMRERATLAGGRLSVESQPGKGTRVVLTIQVQR